MKAETTRDKALIQCVENGPYIVRGIGSLVGSDGQALPTKPMIALCRCGGSKSKPFCDGTHSKIGFKSEERSASR